MSPAIGAPASFSLFPLPAVVSPQGQSGAATPMLVSSVAYSRLTSPASGAGSGVGIGMHAGNTPEGLSPQALYPMLFVGGNTSGSGSGGSGSGGMQV